MFVALTHVCLQFLIGVGVLFALEVLNFFLEINTETSDTSTDADKSGNIIPIILSVIMLVYYVACLFFGYRLWKA